MSDNENEEKKVSETTAEGKEADAGDGDGEVYDTRNEVLEDSNEAGYQVTKPNIENNHVKYTCEGVDDNG